MTRWIFPTVSLALAAAMTLFMGCKKTETPPPEPAPVEDTALVLPEVPELDPVEEAFPDPEPEAPAPAPKPDPSKGVVKSGAYTLQVGIYNTERQAKKRAEALKGQGFPAYVSRVVDPTPTLKGTYYRVRIGSFATTKAAREYGQTHLAPQGIEYWADLKGRDSQPVKQVFQPQAAPQPAPAPAPAPAEPVAAPVTEPAPPAPAAPPEDTASPKLPDW